MADRVVEGPEDGVAAAVLVIARHVPRRGVVGVVCGYCGWPFPCGPLRLANSALVGLGVLDRPILLPPMDPVRLRDDPHQG